MHLVQNMAGKLKYPVVRRDETVVDDYHGTKVYDPYRWLENGESEETKQFVTDQMALTEQYFSMSQIMDKIDAKIKSMYNHPKYGCPGKNGDKIYYFHNSGLQAQDVMYVQDKLDSEPRVFIDPNTWSDDGSKAIYNPEYGGIVFSNDGLYLAYCVTKGGTDWLTIKVKNTATGEDLDDTLDRVKFTQLAWTPDNKGFFYNKFDQDIQTDGSGTDASVHQKLYYHRLGEQQSNDTLCLEFPEHPLWQIHGQMSTCGRYLVITTAGAITTNKILVCDLHEMPEGITGKLIVKELGAEVTTLLQFVCNEGSNFIFRTSLNANNYKLIAIDLNKPAQANWTTLVAEDQKAVLEWAVPCGRKKLLLGYQQDVRHHLFLHDVETGERLTKLTLPVDYVVEKFAKRDNDMIFVNAVSFLSPGTTYYCNIEENNCKFQLFKEAKVPGFDASQFEQVQVFYPSKDGTKIPMFIMQRKGLKKDGSHPVMLLGYGGFAMACSPLFITLVMKVGPLMFLQNFGGIFAVAGIRGGGEYGKKWHDDGKLEKKQNCFDDFQYAAKFLVEEKYTTPSKLTIVGGSNGGYLVGACVNQSPHLFGCAVLAVGLLDIVRSPNFTIGAFIVKEYGDPAKPEEFAYLYKTSPVHNVRVPSEGKFPALLVTTADKDDRCPALHSYKYIAEVQHTIGTLDTQSKPLLLWEQTDVGHYTGKSSAKFIEELIHMYTFMAMNVDIKWQD